MKKPKESKKFKNTGSKKEISDFFDIDEDFIPYAYQFGANTVVTKNLQTLQTIKINNFLNKEFHHDVKHLTLREVVRSAIETNIKSNDFAFWIHTVRRKADLHNVLTTENKMVQFVNDKWNEYNHFETQFINELYVTVLISGIEVSGKEVAFKYITDLKLKEHINKQIAEKEAKLNEVVNSLLLDLVNYSPKKLGVVERGGVLYSENIEFFHKVLNLTDIEAPLEEADIGSLLAISKMSLGKNSFDIKNEFLQNSVSVLTLKHYLETLPSTLDKILTLPFEFIIYQAFDFINIGEIKDKYETQYKMLKASKDGKLMKNLGLIPEDFEDEKIDEDTPEHNILKVEDLQKSQKLRYGENQIAIIIIGQNQEAIESETAKISMELSSTGFVFIREDVMMEETFFGSLPGNFFFLKRMKPIQTKKLAGFASIDNYPIGKISSNKWGDAVALFKTKEGLPFFFNFHDESEGGHTIMFGKHFDIQKNAVTNFLELQSTKFGTRIINIDFAENTKLFNAFMGGVYTEVSFENNDNSIFLNPCKLLEENFKDGIKIFEKFLILNLEANGHKTPKALEYLKEKLMPFIKKHAGAFNTIEELSALIKNPKISSVFFSNLLKGAAMGNIFSTEKDTLLSSEFKFLSINIESILGSENLLKLFFEYFLESILLITKDKKNTILKIDNFFEICRFSEIETSRIIKILKELKENNVVLLALESYASFKDFSPSKENADLIELISTQIFFPAFVNYGAPEPEIMNNYLNEVGKFTNLTPHEKDIILKGAYELEYFTVKHMDKIVSLYFDPDFNDELYFFLSSRGIEDTYFIGLRAAAGNMENRLVEASNLYAKLYKK